MQIKQVMPRVRNNINVVYVPWYEQWKPIIAGHKVSLLTT